MSHQKLKQAVAKRRKAKEDADFDDDEPEGLGMLESFVRLWFAEQCLEVVEDLGLRQTIEVAVVLLPLLHASVDPSGRSLSISWALVVNAARRVRRVRVLDAVIDVTVAWALYRERLQRTSRKKALAGALEREAVATFAWPVRLQCVVASFFAPWPSLVVFAANNGRLRTGVPPFRHGLTRYLVDDCCRLATLAFVLYEIAVLVDRHRGRHDLELAPTAAASRLFVTMPCAMAATLDEWLFVDVVFAAVALCAICLGIKRDFVRGHKGATTAVFAVHLAYKAAIALVVARSLFIDRRAHNEIAAHANKDVPVSTHTQRLLEFQFAEDRATRSFRRPTVVLLAISLACALHQARFWILTLMTEWEPRIG